MTFSMLLATEQQAIMSKSKNTSKVLLLGTDGSVKLVPSKSISHYIKELATLPIYECIKEDYDFLIAYVDGEFLLKDLPTNPYSVFVEQLGFRVDWNLSGGIWGNIIIECTMGKLPDLLVQKARNVQKRIVNNNKM